ncbi:hypothetical protein BW731_08465 [Vagococcus martis]|uniref:DNA-binding response regulator n=1 Tax=Vagococcus martis TaxID=1768210 RepID=A0A1V4DIE2_9ENTE|nr:response regulator transcription factor [Vagococcus martis]OPF88201.1 hypothetical protein BW731_08465 [Vagococcus martis]
MTIMLIEPNHALKKTLTQLLTKNGYHVISATSDDFLFDTINEKQPQLIIMNVDLNQMDGFFWCQEIRKQSTIPIIFLSDNNTITEQKLAIEAGADDYLSIPFVTDLLLVKITSLLRRTYDYIKHQTPFILSHNGLTLDTENNTLRTQHHCIELSKNECRLLVILFKQPGKVIKREIFLRELWKDERYVDDNTLTVNINRIRKKMKSLDVNFGIQTKIKQGYFIP